MSSGNWTLRGLSGKILKDSNFMKTFEISLKGQLQAIIPSNIESNRNALVVTEGYY